MNQSKDQEMMKMRSFGMNKLQFEFFMICRGIYSKIFGLPPNVFIQNLNHCHIGANVFLGPGVCIVSSNHNPTCPEKCLPDKDVIIGDNCWLGANVVILPGVTLGPNTIVGANAVVTESFPDGHILLVGIPAVKVKSLD
jgi:acetyltransferase-like isoleucine patch superfamily enzyme